MGHSTQRWLLAGVLTVAFNLSRLAVFAQDQSIPPDLKGTMDSIDAARAAGDGSEWGQFAAEDYVVTHPDGRVHHRAEEVAEIKAAGPTASSFRREDIRLHRFGGDIIIITSQFQGRSGQANRASDVWVRQADRWMIAAAQLTPIRSQ